MECVNVVGIKEEDYFNSVKIYPNPTVNKFKIESSINIESAVLINVIGQSVMSLTEYELKEDIDLDNFPKGIYFLNLKANGIKKLTRLLKNNLGILTRFQFQSLQEAGKVFPLQSGTRIQLFWFSKHFSNFVLLII